MDVATMRPSWSKPAPTCYEIKVSRADFLQDRNAGKYQRYLPFVARLYFATPAKMLHRKEIPNGMGLICRSDKGWYTVVSPHLREPQEFEAFLWSMLLRSKDAPWRSRSCRCERLKALMREGGLEYDTHRLGKRVADLIDKGQTCQARDGDAAQATAEASARVGRQDPERTSSGRARHPADGSPAQLAALESREPSHLSPRVGRHAQGAGEVTAYPTGYRPLDGIPPWALGWAGEDQAGNGERASCWPHKPEIGRFDSGSQPQKPTAPRARSTGGRGRCALLLDAVRRSTILLNLPRCQPTAALNKVQGTSLGQGGRPEAPAAGGANPGNEQVVDPVIRPASWSQLIPA